MSFSDQSSSLRIRLLVEDEEHDVLECSVAGVSLARTACHSLALGALQRGDERPATLTLSGPGGARAYDVIVRLAARGPAHVEFAFSDLAPEVRRVLKQIGPIRAGDEEGPFEADPDAPGQALPRRLILHLSEAVAEATRLRRPTEDRAPPASVTPPETPSAQPLGIGLLLVVMAGVIALAVLGGVLLFR